MRRNTIRNSAFREVLNAKPIVNTIEEGQLKWLGHMYRMKDDRNPRRIFEARPIGRRRRERLTKSWYTEVKTAAT